MGQCPVLRDAQESLLEIRTDVRDVNLKVGDQRTDQLMPFSKLAAPSSFANIFLRETDVGWSDMDK